jgi:hypothetical protein
MSIGPISKSESTVRTTLGAEQAKPTSEASVSVADLQTLKDTFQSAQDSVLLQRVSVDGVSAATSSLIVGFLGVGAVFMTGGVALIPIALASGGLAAVGPAWKGANFLSQKRSQKKGGAGDPKVHPQELARMLKLQEQAGRFEQLVIATYAQRTLKRSGKDPFTPESKLLVNANFSNVQEALAPSEEELALANAVIDFLFAVEDGKDPIPAAKAFRTFPHGLQAQLRPLTSTFKLPEAVWDVLSGDDELLSQRMVDLVAAVQERGDPAPAADAFRVFAPETRAQLKPMLAVFNAPEVVWDVVSQGKPVERR